MVSALDDPSHWSPCDLRQLVGFESPLGHHPDGSDRCGLVDVVSRDRSCRLQESTALSASETLFLFHQFGFELFNQLGDQSLKFWLAASKGRLMPDRFVAHAQIGQHQLKGVDSGVAVQGFSLQARRGYDTASPIN